MQCSKVDRARWHSQAIFTIFLTFLVFFSGVFGGNRMVLLSFVVVETRADSTTSYPRAMDTPTFAMRGKKQPLIQPIRTVHFIVLTHRMR